MKLLAKLKKSFDLKTYLIYVLFFVIVFGLFLYISSDLTFSDPDSFYHAQMALTLRDQGAITQFPWLSGTNLKYSFTDHQFLYHLILIPFVSLFTPLVGLKFATVLFASLMIWFFYWFLKQFKIHGAFWYGIFLTAIAPFVFRLNLAKAQGLVLLLLFIFLYLLFKRQYLWLILVSAFYVWLYAGWPLLLVLTIIYLIVNLFYYLKKNQWFIVQKIKSKIKVQSLLLLFSVVVGLAAGLFFNPYFPENLSFYWQQTFQIALFNYHNVIGVGGEWYPYAIKDLILDTLPFFILYFISLVIFVINYRKQAIVNWFFAIVAFLFLALTLKSQRNVEYLVPFGLVFCALTLNVFMPKIKAALKKIKLYRVTSLVLIIILSTFLYLYSSTVKDTYASGFSFDHFSASATWLKDHAPKQSIVFHSDWDEFPFLFYFDSNNYYIVGLDPTFMYLNDPDLYQRWDDVVTGKTSQDLYQTIKELFNADYVFVDYKDHPDFDENLLSNIYFKQVYSDNEAHIYQVESKF
ncbi:MAG: hypothetical protein JW816_03605 [Candidatus Buchananbacteria bacterium]|nr:hypothetical protein [Candidatus Buchananbacteria bacterium]